MLVSFDFLYGSIDLRKLRLVSHPKAMVDIERPRNTIPLDQLFLPKVGLCGVTTTNSAVYRQEKLQSISRNPK